MSELRQLIELDEKFKTKKYVLLNFKISEKIKQVSSTKLTNWYKAGPPPPAKKLKIDFEGHAKASSFNNLSTKSHYELACNALDRIDTVVEQERRTNKLLSTCTETVSIRLPLTTKHANAEK